MIPPFLSVHPVSTPACLRKTPFVNEMGFAKVPSGHRNRNCVVSKRLIHQSGAITRSGSGIRTDLRTKTEGWMEVLNPGEQTTQSWPWILHALQDVFIFLLLLQKMWSCINRSHATANKLKNVMTFGRSEVWSNRVFPLRPNGGNRQPRKSC